MYSYLSTSRGGRKRSLNCWNVGRINCIATYQPREGPETHCFFLIFYFLVYQCIATYLPREGPETRQQKWILRIQSLRIATYLPRKWPETNQGFLEPIFHLKHGLATYPPRERPETQDMKYLKTHYGTCIATYLPREGPETCPVIQISFCFSSYSYLSTSRGAGNRLWISFRSSSIFCIDTYLPREGSETHKRTCTPHQSSDLYSSQYTSARGRKHKLRDFDFFGFI